MNNDHNKSTLHREYRILDYWKGLLLFVKNPTIANGPLGVNKCFGLKQLFIFYFLFFQIVLIYAILIGIIDFTLGKNLLKNILNNDKDIMRKLSIIQYVITVVVLAPVYEELIFRNYLKLNKHNLAISLSIYIFIIYGPIIPLNKLLDTSTFFRIFYSILSFILIELFIKEDWIAKTGKKYFKYIFYFSVLLFGYCHLFNYSPISPLIILFSPVLLMPQLFAGIILGYIRIYNGMKWAITLHIFINMTAVIFRFVFN